MSEELENENVVEDEVIVEIYDEDGNTTKCEVYDVIDFEEKTYALLAPIEENENEEEQEIILMEYVEEGDECYFQNIESEEEFNKVSAYIESLEDEIEE